MLLNHLDFCLLFQQRKRNLPQTTYVELALVVDNLRVGVNMFLVHFYVKERGFFVCFSKA